jgi:hypothetical protein
MKYQTLAHLRAAYKAGEVTAPITIDSWRCYLYAGPDDDPEQLFRMETSDLLEEALALLGIPWKDA